MCKNSEKHIENFLVILCIKVSFFTYIISYLYIGWYFTHFFTRTIHLFYTYRKYNLTVIKDLFYTFYTPTITTTNLNKGII